jgi:hypothetical protein
MTGMDTVLHIAYCFLSGDAALAVLALGEQGTYVFGLQLGYVNDTFAGTSDFVLGSLCFDLKQVNTCSSTL